MVDTSCGESRRRMNHGQTASFRCPMGTDQTPHSSRAGQAQRRASSGSRPGMPDRNPLCTAHRDPLGVPAKRNGLWKWHDLLAPAARLAKGWGVGGGLACPIGRTWESRGHRLVHLCSRWLYITGSFWGAKTGPNPTDRGKRGSKRHLIVDGQGTPLAIEHTGANVHDSEMAMTLVDAVPAIKQPRGGRRKRPDELLADRAYDAEAKIRGPLRARNIAPMIPKRSDPHGSGLGRYRYVVEAAFHWLFNQRRLRVRYEKRPDIHQAFLNIACALICWGRVERFC